MVKLKNMARKKKENRIRPISEIIHNIKRGAGLTLEEFFGDANLVKAKIKVLGMLLG